MKGSANCLTSSAIRISAQQLRQGAIRESTYRVANHFWLNVMQMKGHRFARNISEAGHSLSAWVAEVAAQPICQAGVIAFCTLWWLSGLPTDVLTATLSILAITLTQMVLNRQSLREEDDRRRDVAMHAKLDELLRAEKNARKELAGIEELETEEITALKDRLAMPNNYDWDLGAGPDFPVDTDRTPTIVRARSSSHG